MRGGASEINQIGRIAAVEREIDDALLVDYLADARATGLDGQRGCFHLHLLAHRTELHGDFDGGAAGNLQHDTALDRGAEAIFTNFQAVGADGKIRKNVRAIRSGLDGARQIGIGFYGFDLGAGDGRSGRIVNRA